MVGNAMVTIEKNLRDSGWELLRRIQKANIPLAGLFWAEFSEGDWRLYVVSPLVDTEGTGRVYELIRPLFPIETENGKDGEVVTLDDLNITTPRNRTVLGARDWARARYGTADGSVADDERIIRRISLTPSDAYIYYLAPEK